MDREEGRVACGSPAAHSDVLSNPASAWVRAGPGPGEGPHEAPRPEAPAQIRALREIGDDRS